MRAVFLTALLLFPAVTAFSQTNALSDKEIQGQALVRKIMERSPSENYTNTGTLVIRDGKNKTSRIPITFETTVTPTNWSGLYEAQDGLGESLTITHIGSETNEYIFHAQNGKIVSLSGNETMFPFAGSDFLYCDLGLEFLHWPQQKVLKREVHSSRGCTVLESTNPDPATNGYSRVMAWIDTETLGIIEAYAYDAKGKELKIFTPKDYKKVNGQWQVLTFVIENTQTGSRSRLEFDLKK